MGTLCIILGLLALIGAIAVWTFKAMFWVAMLFLLLSFIAFIVSSFDTKNQ